MIPAMQNKAKCKAAKRQGAFTLVELLIVTAIIAILALSLASAFWTGVLSYKKIDSAFEVYQAARMALQRIELDLKNSFAYFPENSQSENYQFRGEAHTLEFFSVIDSYDEGAMYTDICRIKYALSNGALRRTCYRGLDALKKELAVEGEELAPRVKEISFQYAYPADSRNDSDNPYDWSVVWPKNETQKNLLPLAVKIKLSLIEKGKQGKDYIVEFEKVVAIPLGG